jgi:EF-P beta-lysylation protein EpmB
MTVRWQQILAQGFGNAKALLTYLGLPTELADDEAAYQFPTRVPKGFADRMVFGDANDPLLKQVLAVANENDSVIGYEADPLAEKEQNPLPGLIHKYHGRVLITLAGACAINCRYCFRRHFPYHQNILSKEKLKKLLDYIAHDPSIQEVILSGGDPLLISDDNLSALFGQLEAIPHVSTIRIHSRIPIVLPERMTTQLLDRFHQSRCQVVLVVHCNHPNELIPSLKPVFQLLRQKGVHLFNQAVLLHQINDKVDTLIALCQQLFSYGILPYYLHTLDKVAGAAHFDIKREEALALHQALQAHLPGYLVPKLVTEKAGVRHKIWLTSQAKLAEVAYPVTD